MFSQKISERIFPMRTFVLPLEAQSGIISGEWLVSTLIVLDVSAR